MPDGLKKKVGPLPVWAWAIIAGGIIGGIILYGRRGSSSGNATPVGSTTSGVIDPTTGLPYAGLSGVGGSLTGGGSAPTLAQEISDVTGLVGLLQGAGLVPMGGGDVYYVTNSTTGQPTDVAVNSATTEAPGGKPSPLDRAKAAVQAGRVGPVNTQRLKAAGYTQSQINYHVQHKTPLGQPHTKAAPHQQAAVKPKTHTSAPTHPNQHVTAAAPHHGAHPKPIERAAPKVPAKAPAKAPQKGVKR